jgi:hypothetical protein
MQRLLGLLNQKDSVKTELEDLQSDQQRSRTRTPPSELILRAPSYTCYAPVFTEFEAKNAQHKSFVERALV